MDQDSEPTFPTLTTEEEGEVSDRESDKPEDWKSVRNRHIMKTSGVSGVTWDGHRS